MLAEGLRAELYGKPIKVSVLYPGYIASEMNEGVEQATPLMVSTEKGRSRDGRRDREGEGLRLRAGPAVGPDEAPDEARTAAAVPPDHLRNGVSRPGTASSASATASASGMSTAW